MRADDRTTPEVRRRSGGFTMIEVIVAIVILAIGLLGLAGTTTYIVRQITLSDLMTERTAAFQTVVDRLQSAPYGSMASGSDSVGIYQVDWTSVDNTSQDMTVTIVTTGPGLSSGSPPTIAAQVVDTFEFRLLRQ